MQTIEKPAYNEEFRTCQFRRTDGQGQLNSTETVSSAEVVCAERNTGVDTTSAMISDVAPYSQTYVRYKLKAGAAGTVYILSVRCTTSNGQKLEEKFLLKVI